MSYTFSGGTTVIKFATASELGITDVHPYAEHEDEDYREVAPRLDSWYWLLISDPNNLDGHNKHQHQISPLTEPQGPFATLGEAFEDACDPTMGTVAGEAQYKT